MAQASRPTTLTAAVADPRLPDYILTAPPATKSHIASALSKSPDFSSFFSCTSNTIDAASVAANATLVTGLAADVSFATNLVGNATRAVRDALRDELGLPAIEAQRDAAYVVGNQTKTTLTATIAERDAAKKDLAACKAASPSDVTLLQEVLSCAIDVSACRKFCTLIEDSSSSPTLLILLIKPEFYNVSVSPLQIHKTCIRSFAATHGQADTVFCNGTLNKAGISSNPLDTASSLGTTNLEDYCRIVAGSVSGDDCVNTWDCV